MIEKELYRWGLGNDNDNIKVLEALNKINEGFGTLTLYGGWEELLNCLNLPTSVVDRCERILPDEEIWGIWDRFESIRSLIFGDKIDFGKLLIMLKENVDKYGSERIKEKL